MIAAQMPRVILPPHYPDPSGPVVFLAGPIQGAPLWQVEAAKLLHELMPELHVANPRRVSKDELVGYDEQVDWETHHLRRAAATGVILFWLAKEETHTCERAYAQTTRFELAEWKVRHERDGVRLVVGIEDGFTGAKYIRRRFGQDCPGVPVCGSLREACEAAVRLVGDAG
jgi:hypothetical protein